MKLVVFLGALIGLGLASIVTADEYPSMVGTWKGTSEAVVLGDALYYKNNTKDGTPRMSSAEFVLDLTHQDGRRIWGSLSSNDMKEPWIGVFWNDKESLQAVDSNGHITGRILDANTMEVVYSQIGNTLITSHVIFSRK